MMPGKKYKGYVSTRLASGSFVVDLFNDHGILDWLEDIDPVILDLGEIPVAEGSVIEFCKTHAGDINILTIQV